MRVSGDADESVCTSRGSVATTVPNSSSSSGWRFASRNRSPSISGVAPETPSGELGLFPPSTSGAVVTGVAPDQVSCM
jgi:hypothetical protein